MSLMSQLCFTLAKRRVLSRKAGNAGENPATFDRKAYQEWRASELRAQFLAHFDPADLAGRDVLDFGCGGGDLSFLVSGFGVKSITGVDVDEPSIRLAQSRIGERASGVTPRFLHSSNTRTIGLPDASLDIVLCFDVLEHVMDYEAIIPEWKRVLRKGGRVWIWWVPWYHPYGPHIESLIPVPWAHAFFSDKTLIETCARIYDLPEFKPRLWDLDEKGRKKPNKWLKMDRLPGVNKLTMARFEKIYRRVGFQLDEYTIVGFGGPAARLTKIFTRLPGLREFFCSRVIYKLRKGD